MKTNDLKLFGTHVKNLRLSKNLSQEELAERAGMHRTYIGMVERGERNPALLNLIRLSKALCIPLSQLVSFLEKKNHESN
ncbi:helix-turn-helix domain-containing protein [Neisseria sp. S1]|uniref:helix-turn-helix domain-containing protein n=1 Tax=Neisseria sp. S1 TaxID=3318354 RepID=UPI003A8C22F0